MQAKRLFQSRWKCCCTSLVYLIRNVRLNIPAWHVGAWGGSGEGRTELNTKTAGLSPEWHSSHLSYPKPQLLACVLSLQPKHTRGNYSSPRAQACCGWGILLGLFLFSVGVPLGSRKFQSLPHFGAKNGSKWEYWFVSGCPVPGGRKEMKWWYTTFLWLLHAWDEAGLTKISVERR